AIVVKQDSVLEAQKQQLGEQRERLCRQSSRGEGPLGDQERLRSAEQQREELVGLRRQHGLLQEEFQRCRRSYEEKTQELRALEARLHEAHRSQDQLRGQLEELSRQAPALAQAQAQAQASAQAQAQASAQAQAQAQAQASAQLRRGRRKAHTRQLSLPSAQFTGLSPTQNSEQRRRSMDASCLQASLDFVGEPREGLNGQERPVVRDGLSEGAESGTPHEVTLAPHQEARVEEEDEEEAGSQSEGEEVSGKGRVTTHHQHTASSPGDNAHREGQR
ncbi:rho guanine nucleotide exchange factor 2-like, partial [Chiloscyllium plagiosum]|uniref:rho guanine nucleotide exchange factor 2-like n=1 Tax=Chiloscyllium plagiosum TaxID=36176 RepID=UPI001CB82041